MADSLHLFLRNSRCYRIEHEAWPKHLCQVSKLALQGSKIESVGLETKLEEMDDLKTFVVVESSSSK